MLRPHRGSPEGLDDGMTRHKTLKPVCCPHCGQEVVFESMPYVPAWRRFWKKTKGYATDRWLGARKEEPYSRCPACTATFPKRGLEEYLAAR